MAPWNHNMIYDVISTIYAVLTHYEPKSVPAVPNLHAYWILDESALATWTKNCNSWAQAQMQYRLSVWSSVNIIWIAISFGYVASFGEVPLLPSCEPDFFPTSPNEQTSSAKPSPRKQSVSALRPQHPTSHAANSNGGNPAIRMSQKDSKGPF